MERDWLDAGEPGGGNWNWVVGLRRLLSIRNSNRIAGIWFQLAGQRPVRVKQLLLKFFGILWDSLGFLTIPWLKAPKKETNRHNKRKKREEKSVINTATPPFLPLKFQSQTVGRTGGWGWRGRQRKEERERGGEVGGGWMSAVVGGRNSIWS